MTLEGKGFFTWKIPRCENGDAASIAVTAKSAGLSHVLVKVADGIGTYNGDWNHPVDLNPAVVQALRSQGVQVWGWQYIYGENPAAEAQIANRRIQQFRLDGFVVNAEVQYETHTKKDAARRYMDALRAANPGLPIALSSFRYPSLHAQFPWREFLEKCDYMMPQIYWIHAHNPAVQVAKTMREFQNMPVQRPVIPTGAAFGEHGWKPTVGEVLEFLMAARSANVTGVNFWEWSEARSNIIPGVWDVIRDFPWSEAAAPTDISQKLVEAWNNRSVEGIVGLYTSTAAHVNAQRTVAGAEQIKLWYNDLLNKYLPGATFKLTGFSGSGNSRHFTWTASSGRFKVENGNDTLGLINDKIAYHYTFFEIQPL